MANLYGVAEPNPLPGYLTTIGNNNISCPAGVETNIMSGSPPAILSNGWYYGSILTTIVIITGATALTALTANSRMNNGADIQFEPFSSIFWTAAFTGVQTFAFYWWGNLLLNPPATTTFQVSITPTTGSVTAGTLGTNAWIQWLRAPDQ